MQKAIQIGVYLLTKILLTDWLTNLHSSVQFIIICQFNQIFSLFTR